MVTAFLKKHVFGAVDGSLFVRHRKRHASVAVVEPFNALKERRKPNAMVTIELPPLTVVALTASAWAFPEVGA